MNELKLEIPSLSENIRIVESFIDNAKDQYNINDDMYGNIMVAVTESVNNAIIHGNGGDSNKNVKLKLQLEEKEIAMIQKFLKKHIFGISPGANHHLNIEIKFY